MKRWTLIAAALFVVLAILGIRHVARDQASHDSRDRDSPEFMRPSSGGVDEDRKSNVATTTSARSRPSTHHPGTPQTRRAASRARADQIRAALTAISVAAHQPRSTSATSTVEPPTLTTACTGPS